MKNKKYYLLLSRITNLEIKKEDVEDYLKQQPLPNARDFLDYIGSLYDFDNFFEDIDETQIDDDTQFFELIKEIREEND